MFLTIILLILGVCGAIVIQNYKTAAADTNPKEMSRGQLKNSIAFARIILQNSKDEEKRAEASQTIAKAEAELERRKAQ